MRGTSSRTGAVNQTVASGNRPIEDGAGIRGIHGPTIDLSKSILRQVDSYTLSGNSCRISDRRMIVSFGDAATEDLFHGRKSKASRSLPPGLRAAGLRKLDMLNAAHVLADLHTPPGNRLEALKGELKGWHSIRINDQWRFVFRWVEGGAAAVRLRDYHR
jgi:proteic killer suppression protein